MSSITLTFLDQILPPFGNAILGGGQRSVPSAPDPFDELIYPYIQIARDDKALVWLRLDECRESRLKRDVVDYGMHDVEWDLSENGDAQAQRLLERK